MKYKHCKIWFLSLAILLTALISNSAFGQTAPPAATPPAAAAKPEKPWNFAKPEYYSTMPEVRVKDVARVLGVRGNQLYGIGLVSGLAGTGDNASSVAFTSEAIANMLERAGLPVDPKKIKVKNFATVMITAEFPAFAREGDTIDITVSSMGDCKSLQGGVLIMTPLKAANGDIYAVAQGPVSLAGFSAEGGGGGAGGSKQVNFLTVGRIPGGATIEKEVDFPLTVQNIVTLVLLHPDFTTALHLRDAVAKAFPMVETVDARDAASVEITVPSLYTDDLVRFISDIENLSITPDIPNRVVINERTGTIVMGAGVQIIPVAIAHGSLSITVTKSFDVSQPPPLSGGFSLAVPEASLVVEEGKANFVRISSEDLVAALNELGATPSDIVAIFQALDASGALQAELVII
jgi:flagellar P-ring protein FlgI